MSHSKCSLNVSHCYPFCYHHHSNEAGALKELAIKTLTCKELAAINL